MAAAAVAPHPIPPPCPVPSMQARRSPSPPPTADVDPDAAADTNTNASSASDAPADELLLRQAPTVASLSPLLSSPSARADQQHLAQLFAHALRRAANTGDVELIAWLAAPRPASHAQPNPLDVLPSRVLPVRRGRPSRPLTVDRQGYVADPDASGGKMHVLDFDSPLLCDPDGSGPVVLAASSGHLEATQLLLSYGADVDERDEQGWTPLLWAVNLSNVSLLSFLLVSGADIDARSTKGTSCDDFLIANAPPGSIVFEQIDANTAAVVSVKRDLQPEPEAISAEERRAQRDRKLVIDMVLDAKKHAHSSLAVDNSSSGDATSLSRACTPSPSASPVPTAPASSPRRRGHQRFSSSASMLSVGAPSPFTTPSRYNTIRGRRLLDPGERNQFAEAELRVRELNDRRRRELSQIASILQVDLEPLIGLPPASVHGSAPRSKTSPQGLLERRFQAGKTADPQAANVPLASGSAQAEFDVAFDVDELAFDFSSVQLDEMLVFLYTDIPVLTDLVVGQAKPMRAPWSLRTAPASILFLASRYCARVQDADLLEGLISAAVDKIEDTVINKGKSLTTLAFWLSNAQLLLYYFLSDATLSTWDEAEAYPALLTDLINEIYIFVIRDTERRIDMVLESALLDYESIPAEPKPEDASTTSSWGFVKGLARRSSVRGYPNDPAGTAHADATSSPASTPVQTPPRRAAHGRSLSSIFTAGATELSKRTSLNFTPPASICVPTPPPPLPKSPPRRQPGEAAQHVAPSPQAITALLTSALEVLQLYEVNPAIIVQLMSQVMFWLGCEVFNRILGLVSGPAPSGPASLASLGAALRTPAQKSRERRRHLCRARATQIRLNLSVLDEWTRRAGLPVSLVATHLAPAQQLCSWLVALSNLSDFGALVATVQQLRALSPPQLARAAADYLYTRNENKLDAECTQYLTLLQADWHQSAETSPSAPAKSLDPRFKHLGEEELGPPLSEEERAVREAQLTVDALFEPGGSIDDFRPAWTALGRPGPAGEMVARPRSRSTLQAVQQVAPPGTDAESAVLMLNSREMLPFVLPSGTDTLLVTPGDALGLGKGHFCGTGLALSVGAAAHGHVGSKAGARSRPSSAIMSMSVDEDSELASVLSGTSSTAASATSQFLQHGLGFSSGGQWRPLPVLPDGLLEKLDRATRARHPPALARHDWQSILGAPALTSETPSSPPSQSDVEEDVTLPEAEVDKPLPAPPA